MTLTNEQVLLSIHNALRDISEKCQIEMSYLVSLSYHYAKKNESELVIHFNIEEDIVSFLSSLLVVGISTPLQQDRAVQGKNRVVFFTESFRVLIEIPDDNNREYPKIYFRSLGPYSIEDVKALMELYVFANGYMNLKMEYVNPLLERYSEDFIEDEAELSPEGDSSPEKEERKPGSKEEAKKLLQGMGLTIFDEPGLLDWDDLAGCEEQKRDIKRIIFNRINKDEIYKQIIERTRQKPNPRMPKGVLFYGPGGVGKTLSARIIASQLGIPVVCFKKSQVNSKWVNEGERNISKIFASCKSFGKVVLFIDELEQVGRKRGEGGGIHNDDFLATLLQEIDGVDSSDGIIVLGSTNMKDIIDPPLLQRFTMHIEFFNPDFEGRKGIFKLYANHLPDKEIEVLAKESDGMPGRAIEYCCEAAESSILESVPKGAKPEDIPLPTLDTYLEEIKRRNKSSTNSKPIGFGAKLEVLKH